MRDKVLCRGWDRESALQRGNESLLHEKSYFVVFVGFPSFLSSEYSVLFSVREGEKMSIDEVLGFFDHNAVWNDQKAQRFLEIVSGQDLDTILAAESLFRGIVLDFGDTDLISGGGNHANHTNANS